MKKRPANCRVVIKDFEHVQGNIWWLYLVDVDTLEHFETKLSFWEDNIIDKLSDAMRWKKVIALADLYRW